MRGIPSKKHIHKYERIKTAIGFLWRCALPNCNHYMPRHMEGFVEGKLSICWGCDNEILLYENNMSDKCKMDDKIRPMCDKCIEKYSELLHSM